MKGGRVIPRKKKDTKQEDDTRDQSVVKAGQTTKVLQAHKKLERKSEEKGPPPFTKKILSPGLITES